MKRLRYVRFVLVLPRGEMKNIVILLDDDVLHEDVLFGEGVVVGIKLALRTHSGAQIVQVRANVARALGVLAFHFPRFMLSPLEALEVFTRIAMQWAVAGHYLMSVGRGTALPK